VMTALVVLEQRPLTGDEPGPTYTITAQDVDFFDQVVDADGSNFPVTAGEQFSERQLLLALLLPSANNIAETLAVWVAGSQTAFLAELNTEADRLGMTQTSFADASGYSPQTVSSAADLVKLGQAALANPVLAGLVATQTAMMPDGTTVQNLDTNLGSVPGWLGIKTGYTGEAGGCLLFAAQHTGPLGSSEVMVVGAILGQPVSGPDGLAPALDGASAAVTAAFDAYDIVTPATFPTPRVAGAMTSAWGGSVGVRVAYAGGLTSIEVRRGALLTLALTPVSRLHLDAGAGTVVGHLAGSLSGITVASWTVTATGGVGQPPWEWLLTH